MIPPGEDDPDPSGLMLGALLVCVVAALGIVLAVGGIMYLLTSGLLW